MSTIVFYHKNCPDGFGARWAAHRAGLVAAYYPVAYGEPLPVSFSTAWAADHIYFLDFCPPREVLDGLLKPSHDNVTVLDHHKTAQAALQGWKGEAIFDMERSGAGIAWDYFHTTKRPAIINYVEDRDLWRWALPRSREISAYVMSWPYETSVWTEIAENLEWSFDDCTRQGGAILRGKDQTVQMQTEQARLQDVAGYRVPIVNASAYFSEVGETLCLQFPDAPFAAYYFDRGDGKRQWGLRSRHGFDVSVVAKMRGGGGHPGAAGWVE